MTQFTLPCSVCGGPLPVDQQMIQNATALGMPLSVQHDGVCPPPGSTVAPVEDAPDRVFRVQIVVTELTVKDAEKSPELRVMMGRRRLDPIFGMGKTVRAPNLAEAINGPATAWLIKAWEQAQQNAAVADLPAPPDAPTE